MSTSLDELFDSNRRWAAATEARSPGFFTRLQKQQAPQYLWIGCADSRVPANEILGLLPGDVFVHRNVANVVVHSDLNCLSAMEYAIDMLKVQHVIVVGHYGCGGVGAALRGLRIGIADNWLRHVQDVRHKHEAWLEALPEAARLDALCELNVLEQELNVCQTTVLHDAWAKDQTVIVHGWVYGLHDGLLHDLGMTVAGAGEVAAVYARAVDALKGAHAARRETHRAAPDAA